MRENRIQRAVEPLFLIAMDNYAPFNVQLVSADAFITLSLERRELRSLDKEAFEGIAGQLLKPHMLNNRLDLESRKRILKIFLKVAPYVPTKISEEEVKSIEPESLRKAFEEGIKNITKK